MPTATVTAVIATAVSAAPITAATSIPLTPYMATDAGLGTVVNNVVATAAPALEAAKSAWTAPTMITIAVAMAQVLQLLIMVLRKVFPIFDKKKALLPIIMPIMGLLYVIVAHVALGQDLFTAIVFGATGPGAIFLNEFYSAVGKLGKAKP